ncbi:hypothetical protein [Cryptosporangium minutisporangium]|uniref:beta-galactosidase n=1 Tax=Cryptosporangium minutisporangium TaxID=113569 RepID=A0ABP6T5Y3_9ACTN
MNATGLVEHPLLAEPPRLSLWRPMTDNDGSSALDSRFIRSGFFRLTPQRVDITRDGESTIVSIDYATAWGDTIEHRQIVTQVAHGDYVFDERVRLPEGTRDGLSVGIGFRLVDGFERAEWVGLGPWENYPDRRKSALFGRWNSSVDDLAVRYVVPQGNGARGDVDHAVLTGPAGTAVVDSAHPLHLTVSRYSADQLEQAAHWWELPSSTATYVNLDIAQRGVGTALLGPDTRPPFRLSGEVYQWKWRLALVTHAGAGQKDGRSCSSGWVRRFPG